MMINMLKTSFFLFLFLILGCSNEEKFGTRGLLDNFLYLDTNKNVELLLSRGYVPGNEISSGILKEEIGDTLLYYQFSDIEDNSNKPIAKFMRIPIQDYNDIRNLYKNYDLDTICHSKTELNYVYIIKNMQNSMIFTSKIYHDSTFTEYNMNKKILYLKYDYPRNN